MQSHSSMTQNPLYDHISTNLNHLFTILKTSIGPLGFDKILIDSIGNCVTTNDGATILSNLKITDPFQQIIYNLSKQVDIEVGDGTTTTALLACLLIKNGLQLKKEGLHCSTIVNGYKLAYKEIITFIKSLKSNADIQCIVKTCLSSKVVNEWVTDLLKKKSYNSEENKIMDVFNGKKEKIGILKKLGKSMQDSSVYEGFAINCRAEGPKSVKNAKVLCIDFDMKRNRMPLTVTITVSTPESVENIKKMEEKIVRDRADKIIKAGVNVLLSTKGFDDFIIRKFTEAGVMTVRRIKKEDLVEVSGLLGVSIQRTLSDMEGADVVSGIGYSDVFVDDIEGDEVVVIGSKKYSTFLLRGSSENILDEMERSIHDARSVISRFKESKHVLPGGGAVECACYLYLMEFKESIGSKEASAISSYAEAFLELLRLIINNAGHSDDLLAELLKVMSEGNETANKEAFNYGIDAIEGKVQNQIKEGIVEPLIVKLKAIRAATEAAISVLRVEEMIVIETEKEPEREMCG